MDNKNTNQKSFKLKVKPSTSISFRYSIIALAITLILMLIIPTILNYAPGTINTDFDVQMSYISYNTQFTILATVIILGIIILTKYLLRDVDKWYKNTSEEKFSDKKQLKIVREKCFTLPYIFFALELLIPFTVAAFVLSITGSHSQIMITKILILLFSFACLLAVVSYIFSKSTYDTILASTYAEGRYLGTRIGLSKRIFLLIFPILIASILFTALIGYSASIIEKENALFYSYNNHIHNYFDENKEYTIAEINQILNNMPTISETDTIFSLDSDENRAKIFTGNQVSNFIVEYTKQLSSSNNGRIYDSYGVDIQGSSIKLKTNIGETYVGIIYEIYSSTALKFLVITSVFLCIVSAIIIKIFGNSLTDSIHTVVVGFQNISNNTDTNTLLPVITNDEIGDLVQAFNAIQKLNSEQLQTIQDNQSMLIEKERLASLGQMIGGIAHNLKTPIFSVSGGIEGLNDLIDEFDSSIEDPNVNDDDMHAIAQDMRTWTGKLKGHVSYMSDIITAVKGQAATLSNNDFFDFTVEDLFKQVTILMKHELKNALITLNVTNDVSNETYIKGNINSLVQVINNLISNAIDAYDGEPNVEIDLSAKVQKNKIVLTIKDYGPGMPQEVQDKVFKQMITTKGKRGTGLGLFMSYSTIKANFHGSISLNSELGEGTTFTITLPIEKNPNVVK